MVSPTFEEYMNSVKVYGLYETQDSIQLANFRGHWKPSKPLGYPWRERAVSYYVGSGHSLRKVYDIITTKGGYFKSARRGLSQMRYDSWSALPF